MAIFTAQPDH